MPSAKSFRYCNGVGTGENTWIRGNSAFSPLRSIVVAVIDVCGLIYGGLTACESISAVKLCYVRGLEASGMRCVLRNVQYLLAVDSLVVCHF